MGEWHCPRCGSNDAYNGNVVAAGGHTVSVNKCRKCQEILTRENYRFSAKELVQEAKEIRKNEIQEAKNKSELNLDEIFIICFVLGIFFAFGCIIALLIIEK